MNVAHVPECLQFFHLPPHCHYSPQVYLVDVCWKSTIFSTVLASKQLCRCPNLHKSNLHMRALENIEHKCLNVDLLIACGEANYNIVVLVSGDSFVAKSHKVRIDVGVRSSSKWKATTTPCCCETFLNFLTFHILLSFAKKARCASGG